MYSCRRIQTGFGAEPPLQNLLTITFQVQLLRSLHVYAITEVNAYTPVLVCMYVCVYPKTLERNVREPGNAETWGLRHFVGICVF